MRFLYLSIVILLSFNSVFGQKATIDSLRTVLYQTQDIKKQIEIELELTGIFAQQNIDSTRKYGHSALKKSKQINNKLLQCQSYLKLVFGYGNIRITTKNDTTWLYLGLAEHLASQINYTPGIAKINNVKGVLYFEQGELEKSIKHYLVAEKLFEKLRDTLYMGYTKNNIGNYYNYAKKYDKALEYLNQSKKIHIQLKQNYQLLATLSNITSIYVAIQDTINVIKAIDEYYYLAQSSEYNHFKILSTDYRGIQFSYQKNYDSAEYYYKKAIALADSLNNSNLVNRTYINLGNLYFEEKQWDKAKELYLLGLEIARKAKSYQTELLALKCLSTVNEKQGKYKEALQYLTEYKYLLDSTKIEFSGSFAEKALSEQELSQRTEELTRLKTEQTGMIKRNNIVFVFVFASVLLFLLIWYIQSSILYGFTKSKFTGDKPKSLWHYIPPTSIPCNFNLIIPGILFLLLNTTLCFILYKESISLGRLMIWNAFVLISYFASNRLLFSIIMCKKPSLKKELILLFSGAVLFSLVITAVALLIKTMNISTEHYLSFVLLIIADLFIILSLATLIQYRNRFDILSENMMAAFNKKLNDWKQSATSRQIIETPNEETITIDNNGKNVEIKLKNLLYIVSDNVYQEIISIEGEKTTKALVRNTMGNIEKKLTEYKTFLRCHRSYIVNTSKITSIIRKSRQYYFVLNKANEKIPISRNAENNILDKFTYLLNN